MSTHLTNAFFLKLPDSRLATLQAWAAGLRPRLLELGLRLRRQWLVQEALRLHDLAALGLGERPETGQSWMQMAYREGRDKLSALQRRERCPELDLESTLALFEDGGQPGHLHGLYFIEIPELQRLLLSEPEVEAQPYQDQTDDRPGGLSEAEWDNRRRLWERLIPSGIPAQDGVTVTLVDDRVPLLIPDEAQIVAAWPTFQSRCGRVRLDAFFAEFYAALRAGGEAPDPRRWRDGLALVGPESPWMAWVSERLQGCLDPHVSAKTLLQPT